MPKPKKQPFSVQTLKPEIVLADWFMAASQFNCWYDRLNQTIREYEFDDLSLLGIHSEFQNSVESLKVLQHELIDEIHKLKTEIFSCTEALYSPMKLKTLCQHTQRFTYWAQRIQLVLKSSFPEC